MNAKRLVIAALAACLFLTGCATDGGQVAGPPNLALRAEMFLVTPATGPVTHVLVRNVGRQNVRGILEADFPPGWKLNKTAQPVQVAAGQTARVPFAIEKGANSPDNSYPVKMRVLPAAGQPPVAQRTQRIVSASAPYLDIRVDGQIDDWKESIPVTWSTYGKKTVIRTGWTKRTFSLLVAVEEAALTKMDPASPVRPDAVQIAIGPREGRSPTNAGEKAGRHEFLLLSAAAGPRCLVLARPDQAVTGQPADPAKAEALPAELQIWHREGWTYYECSIPIKQIAPIEPEPGREFCFSALVHDGDALSRRDWGEAAGLWPFQRNVLAWTTWTGGCWADTPPFDSRIEWGFCSSAQ